MEKLLTTFNSFFKGTAKAVVKGNRLEITIGSQTMIVSFPEPEAIGWQSEAKDLS